jgi:ATP-dependent DNA helicase HFM1/MER3
VRLERFVYSYPNKQNAFMFDRFLDFKLKELLDRHADNKPALIFCNTRKSAQKSADQLLTATKETGVQPLNAEELFKYGVKMVIDDMVEYKANRLRTRNCAVSCVTSYEWHRHDALPHRLPPRWTRPKGPTGRGNAVSLWFAQGHLHGAFVHVIMVVGTTSTLAVGINLPAHLVVIKSTQGYTSTGYEEYSELDVLQMIGRAGRPQFDDTGVAVIMTTHEQRNKYEGLVAGQETVESQLKGNLIEHLNSEVGLGTIDSISSSLDWLRSTFLYTRIQSNPAHYGFAAQANDRQALEQRLQSMCIDNLQVLHQAGLVSMNADTKQLQTTAYGLSMARYYIKHQTMVHILDMREQATLKQIACLACRHSCG